MRRFGPLLLAASLLFAAACNDSDDTSAPAVPSADGGSPSLPGNFEITISNLAFSPLNLDVPPGATVTVINQDSMEHTVTSEAAANSFTPGSVAGVSFDTGSFMGQKSFTIPSSAPVGTVIPYYCAIHLSGMATPNGTITIVAAGTGAGGGLDGGVGTPQRDAGGGGTIPPGGGY